MSADPFNSDPSLAASATAEGILIRSFRPVDKPDVLRLYQEGLLAGRVDPNDRAADIEDVQGWYFSQPADHFWVAEANGAVIGTIAISQDDAGVTHLRRLRVAPPWQQNGGVAIHLIRTAIHHARSHGCLKLVFHTSLDSEQSVKLLNRLGFQFARIRDIGGRHLIEFYDDLYAAGPGFPSGASAPPGIS